MQNLLPIRKSLPAGWRRKPFSRSQSGVSTIEALVAVAVLGIAFIAMMGGISYMNMENRAASQRLLVGSIGTEILELFKALPFSSITNSTVTAPIYLKGSTSPNAAWQVPSAGQWRALPVEDVNSASASTPSLVTDKLPDGQWTVQFVPDPTTADTVQINVTIQWKLYAGATRPPSTYAISTTVCKDFPNL